MRNGALNVCTQIRQTISENKFRDKMEIKPDAIMEFEEAQASFTEGIKEAAKGAKVALDVTKDALTKNKYLQIGIAASFMLGVIMGISLGTTYSQWTTGRRKNRTKRGKKMIREGIRLLKDNGEEEDFSSDESD